MVTLIISWKKITMNFITKLFKSKNSTNQKFYDVILMMCDRLTKYFHIIFFNEKYTIEQLKFVILNRFIRYHELSNAYINDKNKFITSNYWKTFIFLFNIKLKIFTIYHFQIDKQIERIHQFWNNIYGIMLTKYKIIKLNYYSWRN